MDLWDYREFREPERFLEEEETLLSALERKDEAEAGRLLDVFAHPISDPCAHIALRMANTFKSQDSRNQINPSSLYFSANSFVPSKRVPKRLTRQSIQPPINLPENRSISSSPGISFRPRKLLIAKDSVRL